VRRRAGVDKLALRGWWQEQVIEPARNGLGDLGDGVGCGAGASGDIEGVVRERDVDVLGTVQRDLRRSIQDVISQIAASFLRNPIGVLRESAWPCDGVDQRTIRALTAP
jgi:hypothetical protein